MGGLGEGLSGVVVLFLKEASMLHRTHNAIVDASFRNKNDCSVSGPLPNPLPEGEGEFLKLPATQGGTDLLLQQNAEHHTISERLLRVQR